MFNKTMLEGWEIKPLDLSSSVANGGKPGARCKKRVWRNISEQFTVNKIAIQFESRANTLKAFCKKNGIKINIEVLTI